jgi:hypothetical protein
MIAFNRPRIDCERSETVTESILVCQAPPDSPASYPQHPMTPSHRPPLTATVRVMSIQAPRCRAAASRVERLVERSMAFAVEEYDDDDDDNDDDDDLAGADWPGSPT